MRTKLTIYLILITCTFSGYTFAQTADDAKTAFENGKKSFASEKYSEAANFFRTAYTVKKTWKLLFNIGQAEAAAGRYGLALEAFERYLAEGADGITIERRNEILDEIRPLRDMIGDVQVEGPRGLTVYIDDIERGKLPLIAPPAISAGTEHSLVVKDSSGSILENRAIRVRSGQSLTVQVKEKAAEKKIVPAAPVPATPVSIPAPVPVAKPKKIPTVKSGPPATKTTNSWSMSKPESNSKTEQKPADKTETTSSNTFSLAPSRKKASAGSSHKKLKVAGISSLAIGLGSLIAGGITGGIAISKNNELKENCETNGDCSNTIEDTLDAANHTAMASTMCLSIGGAVTVLGVVLLGASKKRAEQSNVALTPSVTNSSASLVIEGRF